MPLRLGRPGPRFAVRLEWQPRERSRSESGPVPEAERAFRAGAGAEAA